MGILLLPDAVNNTPILNRLTVLENAQIKATYFAVVSATSGTITPPTGGTILLDQFASSVDTLTSKIDGNNNPTDITPQEAGGTYVTSTLDVNGNYVLSGTPADASIALIYVYSISRLNFDITKSIGFEETNLFTNADRAKLAIATSAELGYLSGVTSAIQTQIDNNKWTYASVAGSDATTTSTTLVDVTGLSIALLANTVYEIEAVLSIGTSSDTAGLGLGIEFSAAGASVEAGSIGATTTSSSRTFRFNAFNTSSTVLMTTADGDGQAVIKGRVTVGANAGNLTIQHRKQTSGTSTIFIGSFLKVKILS